MFHDDKLDAAGQTGLQHRAPLWEAMLAYRNGKPARFHVPGHKGGAGLAGEARDLLAGVHEVDVTELSGLDDLHHAEGVIAEAERLAAACFGAERTRFLVGGSTAGNLALILAVCKPGDVLLVQRDAHKSVYNGLMLAGARAVLLAPRIDSACGLPCGLRLSDVEAALSRYPEAKGLLLTDPNYYGFGTDLAPIVEAAHRRGVPVLVDAAHGAHYGFHPDVPASPLAAGADGVVQSTHKMLTAMTMGAMLHLQGSLIDREGVDRALSAIQSSSPSYPIMASLDLARRQIALERHDLFGRALEYARRLRTALSAMPWVELAEPAGLSGRAGNGSPAGPVTRDPFKITFRDRTGTLGGEALAEQLEKRGCYPEMADPLYVTLALGLSTSSAEIDKLSDAMHDIYVTFRLREKELGTPAKNITISPFLAIDPDGSDSAGDSGAGCDPAGGEQLKAVPEPVAFRFHPSGSTEWQRVLPEEAVGAVCGRAIVPYPPGVPLLVPGERITDEAVRRLKGWRSAGLRIHGLNQDGTIIIETNGEKP